MKMPKILFITPGPTYRPYSQFFQEKYKLFSEFYGGYILTRSSKSEKIKIGNFIYQSAAMNKRFGNLKYIIFCIRCALKIKKKDSVDYIITYDPLKTGMIGCILKKVLRAKLIVEVNGVYTSSVVWADEKASYSKNVKQWVLPYIMRYVFSQADGIKLLFQGQIDDVKAPNIDRKKFLFPDWVPVSHFKNLGEKKEILFVGFPFYIKGVDILIQSFKKVASRYPDWMLKIMGWYPDKTQLEKVIAGHPQIVYHPPVPYFEMPEHMGKCGVFVLASRTEGIPRVLMESAAAGKPRIGTDVGGTSLIIKDGEDGFLVESEDVQDLAEKMAMLMGDPWLREKIGLAAAERARIEFNEKKYVENYVRLLQYVDK